MVATRSKGPVDERVKKAEGAAAMLLINILTYACGELEVDGEVVKISRPHYKGMAMGWALSFTKESLSDEWLSHEAAIDITLEGLKAVFLADGRRPFHKRVLNRVKRPQEELEDVVLGILWEKRREEVFNDDDLRKAFVDAVNRQAAWQHFVRVSREHIIESRRRRSDSKGHGTGGAAGGRSKSGDHEGEGAAGADIQGRKDVTGGAIGDDGGGSGGGGGVGGGCGGGDTALAAGNTVVVDTSDVSDGPEIIIIDDDDGGGGGGGDGGDGLAHKYGEGGGEGAPGPNNYEHSRYLGDDDQPPTVDTPASPVFQEADGPQRSDNGSMVLSNGEEGGPEGRKEGSGGGNGGSDRTPWEMRGDQGADPVRTLQCESYDIGAAAGGGGGGAGGGGDASAGAREKLSADATTDSPHGRERHACANTSYAVSGYQDHDRSAGVMMDRGGGAAADGPITSADMHTPALTAVLQKREHTESIPEAAALCQQLRRPNGHQGEKGNFHVKEEGDEEVEESNEPAGKRRRVSIEVKPAVVREEVMNAVKAELFGMLKDATRNSDAKAAVLRATYLGITTGKVTGSREVMAELCQLSDSIDVSDDVTVHVAADLLVGIMELVS